MWNYVNKIYEIFHDEIVVHKYGFCCYNNSDSNKQVNH